MDVRDDIHVVMVIWDHLEVVVVIWDQIHVGHWGGDEINMLSHRDGGCGNCWWARVEGRKRHGSRSLLAAEEAEEAERGAQKQKTERNDPEKTKETKETLLRVVLAKRCEGDGVSHERGGEKEQGCGTHC